jgi:2-methylcitrate dehydratase PrpD
MIRRHTVGDSFLGLGATAACGRLLGLSVDQHRHALALAAMYVGTTIAFMDEREHITKAMNLGKSAQTGAQCAILASIGFEGNDSVFEGRHGVLETWAGDESPQALLRHLGVEFEILRTHFKFYSAGHPIHAPVHALLGLMREHRIDAEAIDSIDLHVTSYAANIVADRDTPSICLDHMVAVAAALGKLGVREAHDERNFELPLVKRLRERIVVHRDPDLDARDPASFGARVRVTTNDGRTLQAEQELPPGDYREKPPADWDRIEAKFRDLCADDLSSDAIDSVVREVKNLEAAENVSTLMASLRASP